jgi:hypothetical protein
MIHLHRYHLVLRRAWGSALSRSVREGALLRLRMQDGVVGHADLFSWPELGDAAAEDLLQKLEEALSAVRKDEKRSSRAIEAEGFSDDQLLKFQRHLQEIADMDQRFRLLPRLVDAATTEVRATRENRPVLHGSITNHLTVLSVVDLTTGDVLDARRGNFPALKVKTHAGLEDADSLARLQGHWRMLRLRLDCNERSDRETLLRFLDRLPIRLLQQIDFIEDPFPFDLSQWRKFHDETGIRLALDRPTMRLSVNQSLEVLGSGAAQVYIHKPQWTPTSFAKRVCDFGIETVVTSALGHPVGNLFAASVAAEIAPNAVHGCLTHVVYRDDEISNSLLASKQVNASRMFGNGVGYGIPAKTLQQLRWTSLQKSGGK